MELRKPHKPKQAFPFSTIQPKNTYKIKMERLYKVILTTMYSLLNPFALWLIELFRLMLFTFTSVSSSNLPRSSMESWLNRFSPSSMLLLTSTYMVGTTNILSRMTKFRRASWYALVWKCDNERDNKQPKNKFKKLNRLKTHLTYCVWPQK